MAEQIPVTGLGSTMLPTNFEPIRQNEFILEIEGIPAYMVVSANALPTIDFGEKEIDWIHNKRYFAGSKPTFSTMDITLHDSIAPQGAQLIDEWVRLIWEPITGRMGYSDFYKRDIVLKRLDPVGNVISRLEYTGCFPTNVNYGASGQPDYGADDFTQISLTVRFDTFVRVF
jgi:hypothetical protein